MQAERSQRLEIRVNGGAQQSYVFDAAHPLQQITLPLAQDQRSSVTLALTLPDAISPHAIGMNDDQRLLGIMLARLEFR